MKRRIEWIDISKGILIILVVLGHSHVNSIVNYVIYSFHMAGFFILSGITFRANGSLKEFLRKKIKGLLIPYLAFSILLLAYQFASHLAFHSDFDLLGGLISIVVPVSGRSPTTVYHLWFLPCLFLAEIIMFCIIRLYSRRKTMAFVLLIVTTFGCVVLYTTTQVASVITVLPITIFYILCGNCLSSRLLDQTFPERFVDNSFAPWKMLIPSLIAFVPVVYANYHLGSHSVDMSSMSFGIWPLFMLSGLAGSMALFSISRILGKCRFIESIGKNSLYYYGLHYEILGVARRIRGGIVATIITLIFLYFVIEGYQRYKTFLKMKGSQ